MLQHLGTFTSRLGENGHVVYEYAPCPPVSYPELEDEVWCHRYYLRNLCDTSRFPEWPITDHVPFLQVIICTRQCKQPHQNQFPPFYFDNSAFLHLRSVVVLSKCTFSISIHRGINDN